MLLDVLAALLVVGAAVAFVFGSLALSKSNDLEAIYLLAVGFVSLRAAVQLFRPEAGA